MDRSGGGTAHSPLLERAALGKSRGEVVALERGTLYGLTVYQQRRVSFAKHDPKLSRELFIREALVGGEFDGKLSFYHHNQRLVREIEDPSTRPVVRMCSLTTK